MKNDGIEESIVRLEIENASQENLVDALGHQNQALKAVQAQIERASEGNWIEQKANIRRFIGAYEQEIGRRKRYELWNW